MPNPVVHFEVIGKDGERLQRFYADAFGWPVQADNPMSYGLVDNGGEGINGGIAQGDTPSAMFYVQVDDLKAALETIESLGGKTVREVETIPGMVTFAHFADPEGNVIGLVASETPPAP